MAAALLLVLPLLAGGCSPQRPATGLVGHVEGFAGVVAADEPRAVLVARDILSAGGSAADAAVALSFTMAVTNPSSAGLGGGGVCVIHDPREKMVEVLEFPAGPPSGRQADLAATGRGDRLHTAVPGLPRGLYALHAKYGRLRWEAVLQPAETMARFGDMVSRSLAADLVLAGEPLRRSAAASRIFARPDGAGLVREGDRLVQVDLATLIGSMRVRGPGDFYAGAGAQDLAEAVMAAGGTLTVEDLRDYAPRWTRPVTVPFSIHAAHFPPPPAGGAVAAQMWAMVLTGAWPSAPEARAHLVAEASARALADRRRWLTAGGATAGDDLVGKQRVSALLASYQAGRHVPVEAHGGLAENPSGTAFGIMDPDGMAVACGLTMNHLFGSGLVVPGTGLLLASAPHTGGRGTYGLVPMLVTKVNVPEAVLAGGASGGSAAPAALVGVVARTMLGERPLAESIAEPRVHAAPGAGATYIEKIASPALVGGLERLGHGLQPVDGLGRVNAVMCPLGLPADPSGCQAVTDPRGAGLGVVVGTD